MSPDISKCTGEGCLLKEKCYRFVAEPNPYWQSYMAPPKKSVKNKDECNYYWSLIDESEDDEREIVSKGEEEAWGSGWGDND